MSDKGDSTIGRQERQEGVGVVSMLLGECLCTTNFDECLDYDLTSKFQFLEIHGIECISLGSITSELTPLERVTETIARLFTNSETPLSIGYISDFGFDGGDSGDVDDEKVKDFGSDFGMVNVNANDDIEKTFVRKDAVSNPVDTYTQNVGIDLSTHLSPDLTCIIDNLKVGNKFY